MEHSPLIAIFVILVTFISSSHIITSSATATATATATDEIGFRVELTNVDAARYLTLSERIRREIRRSKSRSRTGMGPVSSAYPSDGEYAIDLGIGTPPQPISGVLDTGSDLVWTQCKTCAPCLSQPLPLYDPLRSSSYSAIPCSHRLCNALPLGHLCAAPICLYYYSYGDSTSSRGVLATETFTFASTKKVHMAFGCGLFNGGDINNSTGVFGFGRGPFSIVSQLGVGKFSYCLTSPLDNKFSRSPLFFGSLARLRGGGSKIKTTPLVTYPPPAVPSFYYLSLKGITVGSKFTQSPPVRFSEYGSGGTIIDSGTQLLRLHQVLFEGALESFQSQTKLPYVNGSSVDEDIPEICFKSTSGLEPVPKLIFNFEGADMDLPRENYMSYDGGLLCVMAINGGDASMIGNMNTFNMHILYDLKNNQLSFEPAKCNKL